MTTVADAATLGEVYDLTDRTCARYATTEPGRPVGVFADDGGMVPIDAELWRRLGAADLLTLHLPEAAGGAGLSFTALGSVVQAVAYHSGSVPIVEKTLLADWLFPPVGQSADSDAVTAVDGSRVLDVSRSHLTGRLERVPWGCDAARVVVLVSLDGAPAVVVLEPGVGDRSPGTSIANEARDVIELTSETVEVIPIPGASLDEVRSELRARAALGRALQIAGAARRACDLTYEYVHAREQFGRSLARFQVVKQTLARMAERATLISTAADSAATALSSPGADPWRAIAAAKWVASRYADPIARDAHQLHGAIGVTVEYPLHLVTSRLWAWSAEHGTSRHWANALGASIRATHRGSPWAAVTAMNGD